MKLKFSLKALCAIITVSALASATVLPPIIERSRAARLSGPGVQIFTEPRDQYFLRQIAGDDFSERVVHVHLDDPAIDDDWLRKLNQFPFIENVSIRSENVTDHGLQHLEQLPNLKSVDLIDTQTTPAGLSRLRDSAPSLRRVEAYSGPP